MTLQKELEEYEKFKREKLSPLETLGDALTGVDERLDYNNQLLMRMLIALGVPPEVVVKPEVIVQPVLTALGTPVSKLDSITTSATTYQTVVEWEVPQQFTGELFEVTMSSTDYAHTRFRLVLANLEQWTDQELPSSLTQPFRGNKLSETQKVQIQAKSSDGTSITVYGAIAGKLIACQVVS
jgi:hypothetical protein